MPVITKAAGIASVASSLYDIHKTAIIYSKQSYNREMGDYTVAKSIGNQKINKLSYKDANRKNWLAQNNFLAGISEFISGCSGYFKGIAEGLVRYLPKLALGTVAIAAHGKGKLFAYIATIGLAIAEIADFIVNSTNLFERTNYLAVSCV